MARRNAPALAPVLVAAALLGGTAAAGLALSEQVLRPRRGLRLRHEVVATGPASVTLTADPDTVRPGRFGIAWRGGHAEVGELLARDGSVVERRLERVHAGSLVPGKVQIGHAAVGDPQSAFGLAFEEVWPESEVGPLPCWVVPPAAGSPRASTWALLVHGYGGSRTSALDFIPPVHALGCTVLALGYRNDPGAPRGPGGRYRLGASEWRDLDAAMRYSIEHGASRLLLVGWSMGGAIALQGYLRSSQRLLVAGIVLDCPALDWRAVLGRQAARRHVPSALAALTLRILERRIGMSLDELDWTSRQGAGRLGVPVLCFHGDEDDLVPVETSRAFAAAAPGLVELEVTEGAGHVGSLYVAERDYRARLASFVDRVTADLAGVER